MNLARYASAYSGAGTLAALHVGATAAIWSYARPEYLDGTSAGAIVAALIALGKTPSDLKTIVLDADYGRLIPMNPWLAPFRGYLASNKPVIAWLRELTEDQTLGDCQIPFVAVTSDLWTGRTATFSNKEHPDMPVWQAVLASMSIPDVFPAWQGRYVDGGVMCNLGVQYLPRSMKRIGFRVVEAGRSGPVEGFVDEQERLIGMMLSASESDLVALGQVTGVPIVDLPGGHFGFLNTAMTMIQKESLYQRGYEVTQQWLESPQGKEWLS